MLPDGLPMLPDLGWLPDPNPLPDPGRLSTCRGVQFSNGQCVAQISINGQIER